MDFRSHVLRTYEKAYVSSIAKWSAMRSRSSTRFSKASVVDIWTGCPLWNREPFKLNFRSDSPKGVRFDLCARPS